MKILAHLGRQLSKLLRRRMAMEHFKEMPDGKVVDLWSYGTPNDSASDFQEITYEDSWKDFKFYMHGAHAMIYALSDTILWGKYKTHANIMMQVRCDGNFGFGGGLLDKDNENTVDALNRELEEEFNLDLSKCSIVQDDHIVSHINHRKKFVTHFYAKEVDAKLYEDIEKKAMEAKEWGIETFGIMRVPLFVIDKDNMRGFPIFLANEFAGNAKVQLLQTIIKRNIMPSEQLEFAISCHKKYVAMRQDSSKN